MSAIVSIFDLAFDGKHRTIKVQSGLSVEEVENLDWENSLIYVNGTPKEKDYVIRENDSVTIRRYPSDAPTAGTVLS